MKNKDGKNSKLSTYAVIMLLTAIIIIIIAAMADNRERAQTDSTTQTIQSIQNEIAQLENDNFELTQENARLNSEAEARGVVDEVYIKLAEAWKLYNEEKPEEAAQKLAEIERETLTAPQADIYDAVLSATTDKEN